MFTVYATSSPLPLGEGQGEGRPARAEFVPDAETQCATLDEALTHLGELVTSEMEDPDGAVFDRYGLFVDQPAPNG